MSKYRYVILGGGVTAGYAAREFVRKGVQSGDLCVVTREGRPPYDRPPLSKDVLQGEISLEDAAIETGAFYQENGIDLKLGQSARSVDFDRRMIVTSEKEIEFEKLLIATACRLEIQLADVENYTEHAGLAAELGQAELKVRLEEMAADEARHARELRRLLRGL